MLKMDFVPSFLLLFGLPLEAFVVLEERSKELVRLVAAYRVTPSAFLAQLAVESSLAFDHSLDAAIKQANDKSNNFSDLKSNWI